MEENGENGGGPASLGAETDVDHHPNSLGFRVQGSGPWICQHFDQIQTCRGSVRKSILSRKIGHQRCHIVSSV
jgi:hypothetical protein